MSGQKANAELAALLREHRKRRRLTGPDLARRIGVTQGTISKLENGRMVPTIDFLSRFAHCLRLNRAETEELVRRCGVTPADSTASDFLRFLPYDFLSVDWAHRRQRTFAASEDVARVIRGYQPLFVPGLLQTEAYARRIFLLAGISNLRMLERAVRARMVRQKILTDRNKRFLFLLTEGALMAAVGTRSERDEQVQHVMELVRRSNVRIGLLTAGTPLRVVPPPPFYIFDKDRVHVELAHGDLWLLEPSHAAVAYARIFDALGDSAVFGSELVARLEQVRRRTAA